MYLSLISDNNSYILPATLDSLLPTHIILKNQTKLEIYKNQTKTQTLDAKIPIAGGKISQSQNYFVVYGEDKVVRLGGGDSREWKLGGKVVAVAVNEPYYIFARTEDGGFYALEFTGQGEAGVTENNTVEGGVMVMSGDRSNCFIM